MLPTLLGLVAAAFAAGFIDAVAGGGGLIQLPALLLLLPHEPLATALGTNKLASIQGTSVAVARYARQVTLPWRELLPAALASFALSFAGARAVSLLSPRAARPAVLVLLVLVAVYTFARRDLGARHTPRFTGDAARGWALATGALAGFYDGFFGPGVGSLLIFVFVGLLGWGFLVASASAKVVNLGSNIAASLVFAAQGNVAWRFVLPMGLANIAGSMLGTRLALRRGVAFVRPVFLAVVGAIILRLGWDLWHGR